MNIFKLILKFHTSARWTLNRSKNTDTRNVAPSSEPKHTPSLSALSG